MKNPPVLVLGATGTQGGAVLHALHDRGIPVRALVRDADRAAWWASLDGVTATTGDFTDPLSLRSACEGVRAVFSMQNAPHGEDDSERIAGRNIIVAARDAGVPHFVHSSVSGTGAYHRAVPGWGTGRWGENYWESKADVEDAVRSAGFPAYTIVRPAFMMENFTRPKADFLFPDLVDDRIVTALSAQTELALVAASDIGSAVAAAVADPARFDHAEIELAGDALTLDGIAATLSSATGRKIAAVSLAPAEVEARGQFPGWINTQEWLNVAGYPARPEHARRFGLTPIDFATWARGHAEVIAHR